MNKEGTVHLIFESEKISDRLTKRDFVIKDDSQYPQFIKFELQNDKCGMIDNFKEGQKINVHFNLRGKQAGNGNFYNQLQAYKLE